VPGVLPIGHVPSTDRVRAALLEAPSAGTARPPSRCRRGSRSPRVSGTPTSAGCSSGRRPTRSASRRTCGL